LLAQLVEDTLASSREEALSRMKELKLFHPREIIALLSARLASGADERTQARLVWMAGEAGERHAVPLLLRCSESPHVNVRRLTASALRKLIESGAVAPETPSIREALERLRKDPAPQVRQDAESALAGK
jgi:HEAT repeat protein